MNDKERNKRFRAARAEVLRERTRIQRDTFAEIERRLIDSDQRIAAILAAQPTDYQAWSLPKLRLAIKNILDELRTKTTPVMHSGAEASWAAGQLLIDEPLAAAGAPIRAMIQTIDMRQLTAMKEFMTDRITDISLTTANRINSELGLVMTGVQSPGEAVGTISRLFRKTNRGRAITIVRTELGRAFSTASHARSLQAVRIVPGLKKQWRRSGKIHSRPSHDLADGQIREVDQPFDVGGQQLMFPRDPNAPASETINCGCESLDYMAHWEMSQPGRQPFSDEELSRSLFKRNLQQELDGRPDVA